MDSTLRPAPRRRSLRIEAEPSAERHPPILRQVARFLLGRTVYTPPAQRPAELPLRNRTRHLEHRRPFRSEIANMRLAAIAFVFASVAWAKTARPTVYLIRHGEKPEDGNGLSAKGVERSQCLRTLFNIDSPYRVGHIMAQKPKPGKTHICFLDGLRRLLNR